ncbi:hypothetical protein BH23BAC3_BH23BAC3_09060 [soil metagenome]
MDRITLKSLTFHARHGYGEQERREGNQFEVDIIAYGAFRGAADQDNDLRQTFNYQQAEQIASSVMAGDSRKLIETLCSDIGSKIFDAFPIVSNLTVSVRKLSPPIKTQTAYAEITLTWSR